jgi:hypothetical protein
MLEHMGYQNCKKNSNEDPFVHFWKRFNQDLALVIHMTICQGKKTFNT